MSLPNFEPSVPANEKDFLYTVLNLPTSASQPEIRERHRALSVIFHPDKQHDDQTRDTAVKKFLEIQKAYEVLSDPFLREVYDALGEEGLTIRWPAALRSKPVDEIRDIIRNRKRDKTQTKLERLVRPRGRLSVIIDAVSIFARDPVPPGRSWQENVLGRLRDVRVSSLVIRHSVHKVINEKTKINASARLSRGGGAGNVYGTVRHQYSPRWWFEACCTLFHPQAVLLQSSYRDYENTVVIQGRVSASSRLFPPPVTILISRRFFRDSLTEGTLGLSLKPPHVTIDIVSPRSFDLTSELSDTSDEIPDMVSRPGSVSGFGVGERYMSYGLTLVGANTTVRTEWGVAFSELALKIKLALELGFAGLALMLTGTWTGKTSEVSASVGFAFEGVFLRLDLAHLEQRLSIPVFLSQDADAALALCTAIVPSTAIVLGYHFILKPRRRAQRAAYFRAAREAAEDETTTVMREAREVVSILKETAKRRMQAESLKGGLVIIEATYGPTEPDEEGNALIVDVTVAVQALVHNSQLYLAGHRSKAGIQGFYDPAPKIAKKLRIQYLFRGRSHYAEIADHVPVVLPLMDHLVADFSAVMDAPSTGK